MTTSDIRRVGNAAIKELRSRQGFYRFWDEIEMDIQDEIAVAVGEAVIAALTPMEGS